MDTIYQSLVAVNPATLIAQVCNLFLQMYVAKVFFLDKIRAILDQRREAADREITDAQTAKSEALEIRAAYEQNLLQSRAQADELLVRAQRNAASRSEEILRDAQAHAARIREKANADIAQEKKKAISEARNEISELSVAIAEKALGRLLTADDQQKLIVDFLDSLGEAI